MFRLYECVSVLLAKAEGIMIRFSVFLELALAILLLLLAGRRRSRLMATASVAFFACALGTLSIAHFLSGSRLMASLYMAAAASQIYAAFRTFYRWKKSPSESLNIDENRGALL
jgi:hypothetical protein